MANAKSCMCKIFWFALLLLSIGITGVSIYYAGESFFMEVTDISPVHKKGHEMLYPPLAVCIHHWMVWVNWTAAREMNFTKHEVLFAMSYLTEIYSNETFDIDEVEQSFRLKLQDNNISSIEQFYKSVAYQKRNIMGILKNGYIPQYDINFQDFWGYQHVGLPTCQLCYQFSSEEIIKIHAEQVTNDSDELFPTNDLTIKIKLSDAVANKKDILSWLAESEYAAQIEGDNWLYDNHQRLDGLFPVGVYPDGFTSSIVLSIYEELSKVGVMNVKVITKVSSSSAPCHEGLRWIASDSFCPSKCGTQRKIDISKNRAIYLISNKTGRIPYDRIGDFHSMLALKYKDSEIQRKHNKSVMKREQFDELYYKADKKRIEYQPVHPEYEQCIKDCERQVGCESWSYTYHRAGAQLSSSANLILIYPSSVTATKEVLLQTWDNFTSNIGGLLGIFMGASFMTICQIFHFCCGMCRKNQVAVIQVQPK